VGDHPSQADLADSRQRSQRPVSVLVLLLRASPVVVARRRWGTDDPDGVGWSPGSCETPQAMLSLDTRLGSMNCVSCAEPVPKDARFCPNCGHLLVQTEERRIVSVLFADLVGFTALSEERDPEQIKHLVDRCFQRLVADITAFGGTVDKIVGDSIVALFGAPKAHEDDAERAVRAALRMQRSLAETANESGGEIRMRIGVNTGEVLVGAISAGGDYTAMGDTVNLASRLEGAAAPGDVLVGPLTRQATAHVIEYQDRGEIMVRGREEGVQVHVARRELAPPGRPKRTVRAPLVGRGLEQLQLTAAIDTSVERRRAQLLMILGEAGMGKTRLAEEVASAVESSHNALVIEGRVLPYGETNPYRPIGEAIAMALDVEPLDSEHVASAKMRISVADVVAKGVDSAEVEAIVQALLHILGYDSAIASLESTRAREEIHAGMRQYLGALTKRRPVVLVLGDVNWADEALLNLVEGGLRSLANEPFVVIATARWTIDEERWIVPPGRHNSSILNLDALDRVSSDRLVRSLLGSDVSDDIASMLYDRSGGNPFFLEELTTLLSDAGMVGRGDAAAAVEQIGRLPDTLRGLVAARIDALSTEERAMVEGASVIGRSGPVYALLLMADLDGRAHPERVFRQLVGKDLFSTEADRWAFRSDLVRDVAYATMTKTARAQHHGAIADWMAAHVDDRKAKANDAGASTVGWHYYSAAKIVRELGSVDGVGVDVLERALGWLEMAGTGAADRDSHFAAAQAFAQALDLLGDDDPRRVHALLGRGRARASLLEIDGAKTDVEQALHLSRSLADPRGVALALTLAGEIEGHADNYDESRRVLRTAIESWRELDDGANLAEALRLHGFASMMAGDHDDAEDDFSSALTMFVELGDGSGEAWCQQNLAWLSFVQGHVADAERRVNHAIALFERNSDAGGLGWAWGLSAFLEFHQGDSEKAATIAEKVLAEASLRGDRFGEAMMQLLSASINLWSGRCRDAIETALEALDVFQSTEMKFGEIQVLGTLGRAHVAVGNFAEADKVLASCRRLAANSPGRSLVGFSRLVSGATAMQQGRPDVAISYLSEGTEDLSDLQIIGSMDREVTLLLAHLQAGDAVAAAKVLASIDPSELASPPTYLDSARALTEVTVGNVAAGMDAADAVLVTDRATYLDRRSALVARGLGHARLGDEEATRVAFAEAIEMIDGTDSRLSQAVTRLAEAIALEAIGTSDAVEKRRDVELQLETLGLTATGWHTLFERAANLRSRSEVGPASDVSGQ